MFVLALLCQLMTLMIIAQTPSVRKFSKTSYVLYCKSFDLTMYVITIPKAFRNILQIIPEEFHSSHLESFQDCTGIKSNILIVFL